MPHYSSLRSLDKFQGIKVFISITTVQPLSSPFPFLIPRSDIHVIHDNLNPPSVWIEPNSRRRFSNFRPIPTLVLKSPSSIRRIFRTRSSRPSDVRKRNRASDCADQHAISCCLFEKLTALLRDFLMDYDPRLRVGQGHEVRFSNLSFGARKRKEWSRRLPWRSLKQFRKSSDPSRYGDGIAANWVRN